jgi:hypothetical protein
VHEIFRYQAPNCTYTNSTGGQLKTSGPVHTGPAAPAALRPQPYLSNT